ncbi:hypothetical protein SCLCIDRAFT_1215522 [Scleroderma citrinum Foug A]|uniref:Uncharacterized protein n=1 Tax=Scleroderma citrinum Foug A TaxID=1036808 RepID=A0A0C3DNF3_9AGAM|nr:hypothetical protein SCLCIDRAFT_1215522 [Scleroderma citrinum Foug A]
MSELRLHPVRLSADSDTSFPTSVGVRGPPTALLSTLEYSQRTFHLEPPYRTGLIRTSQYVLFLATILLLCNFNVTLAQFTGGLFIATPQPTPNCISCPYYLVLYPRRQTKAPSAMYDGSAPGGTNSMYTTTSLFTLLLLSRRSTTPLILADYSYESFYRLSKQLYSFQYLCCPRWTSWRIPVSQNFSRGSF